MKLILITFLFAFVAQSLALLEWPFWLGYGALSGPNLNVTVGNPPQFVVIGVNLNGDCPGLAIKNASNPDASNITRFDASLSSTWHQTSVINNTRYFMGTSGTDDFVFTDSNGKDQTLKQKPFNVMKTGWCTGTSVSLTYSKPDKPNEFVDAVLADQEEKVIVFTVDNTPDIGFYGETGKLTFGGTPKECSTDWHKTAAVPEDSDLDNEQWDVQLDKVGSGKFSASSPGKARFSISNGQFYLSSGTFYQIAKELGYSSSNNGVPCNQTKTIDYTVNGFTINLHPEEYMHINDPDQDGYCYFLAWPGLDNYFDLPVRMFNSYCVMLDYENKQVGFAERLK